MTEPKTEPQYEIKGGGKPQCSYCLKLCKTQGATFTEEQCLADNRKYYMTYKSLSIKRNLPSVVYEQSPKYWEEIVNVSQELCCSQDLVRKKIIAGLLNNDAIYWVKKKHSRGTKRMILSPDMIAELEKQLDQPETTAEDRLFAKKKLSTEELEQLRLKHPLVKDDRCFYLEWFPDIALNPL